MISRKLLSLVFSIGFFLSTCLFVQGQSTYGSITGSVNDPSGAAVADAQVSLTNLGTSEKRVQPTGQDGLYTFVNLVPGQYRIDVEKAGFKHFTRQAIA